MQNFHKSSKQKIDNTDLKLLSYFCYEVLHLSKVVLAICDISTNSQK